MQNVTIKMPDGVELSDNSYPSRRIVGIRNSKNGYNWTCAPSSFAGGNPFCPTEFNKNSSVIYPEKDVDPIDTQFYRARPFRYFDRWMAAIYYYAPSPLQPHRHGPHMGTIWWVNNHALSDHLKWVSINSIVTHSIRLSIL